MNSSIASLFSAPLVALALLDPSDAAACGGCFHTAIVDPSVQQSQGTQVTGHRMIFSISTKQTSLWDQIKYAGNPSSFAWVLPIRGKVTVGLSSDALADQAPIDGNIQALVAVGTPPSCPEPPPPCSVIKPSGCAFSSATGLSTGMCGLAAVAALAMGRRRRRR